MRGQAHEVPPKREAGISEIGMFYCISKGNKFSDDSEQTPEANQKLTGKKEHKE